MFPYFAHGVRCGKCSYISILTYVIIGLSRPASVACYLAVDWQVGCNLQYRMSCYTSKYVQSYLKPPEKVLYSTREDALLV